jgi:hypothetical protein
MKQAKEEYAIYYCLLHFKNHDVIATLKGQQHLIRFSDSVECGAFIFPLSGNHHG